MKARMLIFKFKLYAICDILFAGKFELKTFRNDWTVRTHTKFCKQEILEKIK